jgi:alkylation response protein AidB-like acyl-CoA dehydrogenase
VQALAHDPRGFPADLWKEMSALGWAGLLVPADQGGSDGGPLDVVLLVEEMGRACLPGPYIASAVFATSLVRRAAGPAQQARLLAPLALGERIATVALVEASGSFALDAVRLGVGGDRLDGVKLFVKDAHVADDLLVVTRGPAGLEILHVDPRQPGVALSPMEHIADEKLFEVRFDGIAVRDADRLGAPADAGSALREALALGALARAAEMVGAAQRILELVVEHARTRVQGGRPIGAHQAIQHRCADLLRNVETSRVLVHEAAWRLETGLGGAAAVATAKAHAGDACLAVARAAHQIFGAISYCEEHPLHLFHKRIQAARLDYGDPGLHLEEVARAIGLA